jgi:hypothetical protein
MGKEMHEIRLFIYNYRSKILNIYVNSIILTDIHFPVLQIEPVLVIFSFSFNNSFRNSWYKCGRLEKNCGQS